MLDPSPALGYADGAYAAAFGEFGRPTSLPGSGGWLLERPVPGTADRDAMGPYPLFACQDWTALGKDLDALRDRLVSVTLVADPFGQYHESLLRETFDRVRPFKNHFVAELARPIDGIVSAHHRYYARRALKRVQVDVSRSPQEFAGEWTRLYSGLIERHGGQKYLVGPNPANRALVRRPAPHVGLGDDEEPGRK